jgi:hypothetical protein
MKLPNPSTLFLALLTPITLEAQDFADLIKNVSAVSFDVSCWSERGATHSKDCPSKEVDYGIEVSYQVKKIAFPWSRNTLVPGEWKPVRKEVVNRNGKPDTTTIFEPAEDTTIMSSYLLIDVAVGYSQFSGFSSADPTFELKGAVREIPSVSIYGTLGSDDASSVLRHLRVRLVLRSGLIQLWDVQANDPIDQNTFDTYTGNAHTFQLGADAGIAFAFKKELYPFVEYSWMLRKFPSVQWSLAEAHTMPQRFPTELDFTGPSLTVGVRVDIR